MTDRRLDKLLAGLKKLVDEFEPNHRAYGPMQIAFRPPPRAPKEPWEIAISSGLDHNYGGTLVIQASPTGKSLRVWKDGKELK